MSDSAEHPPTGMKSTRARDVSDTVRIASGSVKLNADLDVPRGARSVVLLTHGRSERRRAPRRAFLNEALLRAGFATLQADLLTGEEELFVMSTTNEALSCERLLATSRWLAADSRTAGLELGCVAAGPGVTGALLAAAHRECPMRVLATHGGRPHRAAAALETIRVPTLMVFGGNDPEGVASGSEAAGRLRCQHQLFIIPGMSPRLAEPGAVEEVARVTVNWFRAHLKGRKFADRPFRKR